MRPAALLLCLALVSSCSAGYRWEHASYVVRFCTFLSGVVADEQTGSPVEAQLELELRAENGETEKVQAVASGGWFEFLLPLENFSYRLSAWAPGYQAKSVEGRLHAGEQEWVEVKLRYDPFDLSLGEESVQFWRRWEPAELLVESWEELSWRTEREVLPEEVDQFTEEVAKYWIGWRYKKDVAEYRYTYLTREFHWFPYPSWGVWRPRLRGKVHMPEWKGEEFLIGGGWSEDWKLVYEWTGKKGTYFAPGEENARVLSWDGRSPTMLMEGNREVNWLLDFPKSKYEGYPYVGGRIENWSPAFAYVGGLRVVPCEWRAEVHERVVQWAETEEEMTLQVDEEDYESAGLGDELQVEGEVYRIVGKSRFGLQQVSLDPQEFSFKPPHVKGDRELMAKPDRPVNLHASASLYREGRKLCLRVWFEVSEPRPDHTCFKGGREWVLYEAGGWLVDSFRGEGEPNYVGLVLWSVQFQDRGEHEWREFQEGPIRIKVWGDSVGEDAPEIRISLRPLSLLLKKEVPAFSLRLRRLQPSSTWVSKGERTLREEPRDTGDVKYTNIRVTKYALQRPYVKELGRFQRVYKHAPWPRKEVLVRVTPKNGYQGSVRLRLQFTGPFLTELEENLLPLPSSSALSLEPVGEGEGSVEVLAMDEGGRLVESARLRLAASCLPYPGDSQVVERVVREGPSLSSFEQLPDLPQEEPFSTIENVQVSRIFMGLIESLSGYVVVPGGVGQHGEVLEPKKVRWRIGGLRLTPNQLRDLLLRPILFSDFLRLWTKKAEEACHQLAKEGIRRQSSHLEQPTGRD